MQNRETEAPLEKEQEAEINFLDIIISIARHKRLILSITFAAAFLSAIYSLFLPSRYLATTEIMLPGQANSSSMFLERIGNMMGVGQESPLIFNKPVMTKMIKSRPVIEKFIEKFEIMKGFDKGKSREDVEKFVSKSIKAEFDKKTSLTIISVINSDPVLAADMANSLVELLSDQIQKMSMAEATQKRLFFENQLIKAKENLIKAEETMMGFQKTTGVIEAKTQTEAILEQIAGLRGMIISNEVQLSVMKTYSTENNPDLQILEGQIKALKDALSKIETNDEKNSNQVALTDIPSVGTDYIRKLRDLKLAEKIYEVVIKQYETAKLDEAKSPMILHVIEKAVPPEIRFAPARRKIVTINTVTAFLFTIILVFVLEFIRKQKTSDEFNQKITVIKELLSFRNSKG